MAAVEVRDPFGVYLGTIDCQYPSLSILRCVIGVDDMIFELPSQAYDLVIVKKPTYADFYCGFKQKGVGRFPILITGATLEVLKQIKVFKSA